MTHPADSTRHPRHRRSQTRHLRGALLLLGLAAAAASCAHPGRHAHARHHHGHATPEGFARYAAAMDQPTRDAWQQPDALVGALGLRAGDVVADVGAGTGYFTFRLARAVGPQGKVLALDVDDRFFALLRGRPEFKSAANVVLRKVPTNAPGLADAEVDVIFICNTYHHLEARPAWLAAARRALKPGGRIINVDFKDGLLPVGPPAAHKVPEAHVRAELDAAGFTYAGAPMQLRYQYVQVFTRRGDSR